MPETCDHSGCTGRVVCVVQDVVLRRNRRTGRDVIEPDGEPKGFCSEHSRKYNKRRGRPVGQPQTTEEEPDSLPF